MYQTVMEPERSTDRQWDLKRARLIADRFFARASRVLDQHWGVVLTFLVVLYLALAVEAAWTHPLWSDEIYTLHIAMQPTMGKMLGLAREIDLHPPLHYLLQRYSLLLPFPRWLDARLPSIVAGAVMLVVLFRMSVRRFGGALAVTAAATLLLGQAVRYAWENRPYMILFCLVTLLMAAWMKAKEPRRSPWSVAVVFGLSLLMMLDHLIGILCLVPFALAEFRRLRERRWQPDYLMWAALFLPTLVGLGLYYQVHHLQGNSFPTQNLPSFRTVVDTYGSLLGEFVFALTLCVCGAALLSPERTRPRGEVPGWRGPEMVLLLSFLLLPAMVGLAGQFLHIQVWQRYGFVSVAGIALLTPWVLSQRIAAPRTLSVMMLLALVMYMAGEYVDESTTLSQKILNSQVKGRSLLYLDQLRPDLPIVDASPMTFTEVGDREPRAISGRTYFLTDRREALKFSGYTLFDNEAKMVRLLGMPTQVESFEPFLAEHHQFYLVADLGSSEDWLPRALLARHVHMDYLGNVVANYNDDDIYLVTLADGE